MPSDIIVLTVKTYVAGCFYITPYQQTISRKQACMRKGNTIFLVFVLGFILSGCRNTTQVKETIDTSSLLVERVQASYGINVNDPSEMVGYFNYVFVGEIEEAEDTRYYNLMDSDTEVPKDWGATDCLEFTTYKIKVLENIKGELWQTEPISLKK